MSIPFPGYSTNKAMLQPIRDLKVELGLNDSCIQATEVAIKHLVETASLSDLSAHEFIRSLSEKYSVSHGVNDFDKLQETTANSYIVQTYNIVEIFFRNLIRDYRKHKNITDSDWKTQVNKASIDPLNQLAENFSATQRTILLSVPEKEMLDYYRLLRNSIVHKDDKAKQNAQNFYDRRVKPNLPHFAGYVSNAPNPPDEISFNDFVLYSRGLKYYSLIISEACNLKAQDLLRVAKSSDFHRTAKGLYNKNNPRTVIKMRNAMKNYYTHNYGKGYECLDEFILEYAKLLRIPEKVYSLYL